MVQPDDRMDELVRGDLGAKRFAVPTQRPAGRRSGWQLGRFGIIGLLVAGGILYQVFNRKGETIHQRIDTIEAGKQMAYYWDQLRTGTVVVDCRELAGRPVNLMVLDRANHQKLKSMLEAADQAEDPAAFVAAGLKQIDMIYQTTATDGVVNWSKSLGKGTWYVLVEGTDSIQPIKVESRITVR